MGIAFSHALAFPDGVLNRYAWEGAGDGDKRALALARAPAQAADEGRWTR